MNAIEKGQAREAEAVEVLKELFDKVYPQFKTTGDQGVDGFVYKDGVTLRYQVKGAYRAKFPSQPNRQEQIHVRFQDNRPQFRWKAMKDWDLLVAVGDEGTWVIPAEDLPDAQAVSLGTDETLDISRWAEYKVA